MSVRREIIYDSLRYLDTKVEKRMFDIILFYLGINHQQFFHQAEEGTSQTNEQAEGTNDESKRGPATTTTTINDEPSTAQTSQEQNQSPAANEEAEEIEFM